MGKGKDKLRLPQPVIHFFVKEMRRKAYKMEREVGWVV